MTPGPGKDATGEARVREIDRVLARRAPEHDFSPTLDRVEAAVGYLGDPQRAYRVIHVAGTNGKTSTARMIESLLRASGLRTGLFTSPPLTSPRDRIAIDGEPIAPEAFAQAWAELEPILGLVDAAAAADGGPAVSVFEAYALLAFAAFADAPVDVAVVEAGMGGAWDATNVVDSDVQVITPISRDHEEWLGSDLAGIAREKAGILRPGGRAVIAAQRPEAAEVLAAAVSQNGGTAAWEGRDFGVMGRDPAVGGQLVTLGGIERERQPVYRDLFLPLLGAHQAQNAALAVAAVEAFFAPPEAGGPHGLEAAVVAQGLAQVRSPGRLEVVRSSPTVIVDGAHNPAAAQALAEAVAETFMMPLVGLVGVLEDKDAEAILGLLEPLLVGVVVTRSSSPRSMDPEDLGRIAREVFGEDRVSVAERLDQGLALAMEQADIDADGAPGLLATGVLATGSLTIAGEVRLLLGHADR
ncbi:MAG: dihydrofolate synthase [Bifidobacteriaceae bacterium]|nr:dihydrofolate synthase [Bifidobacteriaceae bacterium]